MDGDRRRFEEIYGAYSGLILAYAARRTRGLDDAADVVAETFTVAWRRMDAVPAGEEARPWLYGVARRVVANHHRGELRRRRLDERSAAELGAAIVADGPEGDGQDHHRIAAALAALGDTDRELLTLVGWDGLEPAEIAVVLGTSAAAVRVRLHRARKRFAQALEVAGMQRTGTAGHGAARWETAHLDPKDA